MATLSEPQKYMMDKVRQDEAILLSDSELWQIVYELAREGRSTDEILCWLWDKQQNNKYWLLPQAVNNFLTKKGLTTEVRKALRNVPILEKVDEGIMKRVAMGSEKTLLFMKEKLDPDFQKKDNTNITNNIQKQITQINIQVIAPEDESGIIDITPEQW